MSQIVLLIISLITGFCGLVLLGLFVWYHAEYNKTFENWKFIAAKNVKNLFRKVKV